MFPGSQRLRNNTRSRQIPEIPLRRTLRLPGPEDPARMTLIRIQLRLDVILHVDLIDFEQAVNRTLVFGLAVAVVAFAVEGSVVASTAAETVEPLCAVGLGTGPFAYDEPFVGSFDLGDGRAGCLDVLAGFQGDLLVGEDLVDVGVCRGIDQSLPLWS